MAKCPRCGFESEYVTQTYDTSNGPATVEVEEKICRGCGVVVRRQKTLVDLDRHQSQLDDVQTVPST